jgi:hypothetical protein
MSGPLSSARPFFEVKIGVASWVRRGRRPRPYRNKSGPDMRKFWPQISPGLATSGRRSRAFDVLGVDVIKFGQ